jgi:hypothetical protein
LSLSVVKSALALPLVIWSEPRSKPSAEQSSSAMVPLTERFEVSFRVPSTPQKNSPRPSVMPSPAATLNTPFSDAPKTSRAAPLSFPLMRRHHAPAKLAAALACTSSGSLSWPPARGTEARRRPGTIAASTHIRFIARLPSLLRSTIVLDR